MLVTVDYLDGSERYRDVGMDANATSHCLFSMKFSGPRQPNDGTLWQSFRSEFERVRVLINDHEGPVAFSKGGRFFSLWGIVNVAIFAAAGAGVGAIIAFALTRRYQSAAILARDHPAMSIHAWGNDDHRGVYWDRFRDVRQGVALLVNPCRTSACVYSAITNVGSNRCIAGARPVCG
jgi:hypothetical protein